jgi:hypothetical protein
VPLVRRLSLLLLLEGAALSALGLGYGGYALSRSGDHLPAELAGVAALVAGVVLLVVGRAVGQGRGWARSPAVTLNIFPLPVAFQALAAGAWWVGVPLLLLAGSVLYLFATPSLRETFRER